MEIDEKNVEQLEKRYKDAIIGKIGESISKQFELIGQMTKNATSLGQSNVSIPNSSTTLNNKLEELSNIFKKAGISMFRASDVEHLAWGDFLGSSFLGDAIINDLIDKLAISNDKLREYNKTIGDVSKQRNERLLALQNVSPIRKFFSRIRALFVPVKPIDLSLTEEEQGTLDSSLQEYKDIDSEIFNYNLEDNLVQALVKEIAVSNRYNASGVPELLEKRVIPDLKRLGLEHLVPKLQEALIEEYKKDLPTSEIYQVTEEDMDLYVPDFSQKPTERSEGTEIELQDFLQQTQEVTNGIKSSIKKEKALGGIGLKSFETVDLNVSASERRDATEAISTELSQEQSNDGEKVDKADEKNDKTIID